MKPKSICVMIITASGEYIHDPNEIEIGIDIHTDQDEIVSASKLYRNNPNRDMSCIYLYDHCRIKAKHIGMVTHK